jgi:hypothetical protein
VSDATGYQVKLTRNEEGTQSMTVVNVKEVISMRRKVVTMLGVMLFVLGLYYIGNDACVAQAASVEIEDNGSYADANSLELNGALMGKLSEYDDKDYYLIQPASNGKLSISFGHAYQDNNSSWLVQVYTYNAGSYEEMSYTTIFLNGAEVVNLPAVGAVAGTKYYVVITRDWSDGIVGVDYTLNTSFEVTKCYEKEINDVYSTANDISVGKKYSGNISNSDDKDFYKINVISTGYYKISFGHDYIDDASAWDVSLYNYTGTDYKELSNTSVALNSNQSVVLPMTGMKQGGRYYLKVEKNYGDNIIGKGYSIKVTMSAKGPSTIKTTSFYRSIKLSWAYISSVNGYEVYYKVGKTGTYKKYKATKKTSLDFKKAKRNKKYYFKVRAYVKSGGKTYYSAFSKAKIGKCY